MEESEIERKEIHMHVRNDTDLAIPSVIVTQTPSSTKFAGSRRHDWNTPFQSQAARGAYANTSSPSHGADPERPFSALLEETHIKLLWVRLRWW